MFDLVDEKVGDDLVIECDGVCVLIDEVFLFFLEGLEIDYVDELIGVVFKINNFNVIVVCGCGMSFFV